MTDFTGFADGFYDVSYDWVTTNANAIVALSALPASYADTQGSYKIAQGAVSAADFVKDVGQPGYQRRLDFLGKPSFGTAIKAANIEYLALINTTTSTLIMWWPVLKPIGTVIKVQIGAPISASPKTALIQHGPVTAAMVS